MLGSEPGTVLKVSSLSWQDGGGCRTRARARWWGMQDEGKAKREVSRTSGGTFFRVFANKLQ